MIYGVNKTKCTFYPRKLGIDPKLYKTLKSKFIEFDCIDIFFSIPPHKWKKGIVVEVLFKLFVKSGLRFKMFRRFYVALTSSCDSFYVGLVPVLTRTTICLVSYDIISGSFWLAIFIGEVLYIAILAGLSALLAALL